MTQMWSPCHRASSKQTYVHMWEKLAAFPVRCQPVKLRNPSNWSSRTLILLILVYLFTWGQFLLGQWDLGSKQRLQSVFYLYFNIYTLKQYGYLWQSCSWLSGHWIVSVKPLTNTSDVELTGVETIIFWHISQESNLRIWCDGTSVSAEM